MQHTRGRQPLRRSRSNRHLSQPRDSMTNHIYINESPPIHSNYMRTTPTNDQRNPETNQEQQNTNNNTNKTTEEQQGTTIANTTVTTQPTQDPSAQPWGHTLQQKEEHTIRLLLQNIGGIDLTTMGSIKLAALRTFTQAMQVDICTITECNTDWNKAPQHLYPTEQTRYWWESCQWKVSHNTHKTNDVPYQPGGTGMMILNHLAHRAQCPGDDKVGLGQWCWAQLRGKIT